MSPPAGASAPALCRGTMLRVPRPSGPLRDPHLAAHCLLVLPAGGPALVGLDTEPGAPPSALRLARRTDRLLPVLEQLHQQGELGTAAQNTVQHWAAVDSM